MNFQGTLSLSPTPTSDMSQQLVPKLRALIGSACHSIIMDRLRRGESVEQVVYSSGEHNEETFEFLGPYRFFAKKRNGLL